MRLELTPTGVARATLSRRNAATLMHELDTLGPGRWLESNDVSEDGVACWERLLVARCHRDSEPAASGERGRVVAWGEGATFVIDYARSLLQELVDLGSTTPPPIRVGRLELLVESDAAHYAERLAAPGLMEEETERHLAEAYGAPVREPLSLGPLTLILFARR
jgi:hypothetical protein